jgi:hypothetical protein
MYNFPSGTHAYSSGKGASYHVSISYAPMRMVRMRSGAGPSAEFVRADGEAETGVWRKERADGGAFVKWCWYIGWWCCWERWERRGRENVCVVGVEVEGSAGLVDAAEKGGAVLE